MNNSDTTTLVVLKLCDDGSNWDDYKPHIQRALGSKGLWRHVEGTAIVPKLYALVARVPIFMDGMMQAIEDQIEAREMKIIDYNKCEYLASMSSSLQLLPILAIRSKTPRPCMICGMQ